MGDQLRALIRLRLTLFRNTMTGLKVASMLLTAIMLIVLSVLSISVGVMLYLVARDFRTIHPDVMLLAADLFVAVFVFIWLFVLMIEIQRSEIIDFRKMLYLPVSLRMVFLFNLAMSLLSPLFIFCAGPVLGFVLGFTMEMGLHMLWGLVLFLAFYVMVCSWMYYVRGILAILFENKRRRRLLLALIPMVIVLLGQLPNVLVHTSRLWHGHDQPRVSSPEELEQRSEEVIRKVWTVNMVLPVGWLPYGLGMLVAKRFVEMAACLAAMSAVTGLGLWLAFRSTWRYYAGLTGKATRAPAPPIEAASATDGRARRPFVANTLPLLDDDTTAATLTAFIGYLRQPQFYLGIIMPSVIVLGMLLIYATTERKAEPQWFGSIMPQMAALWPVFCLEMLMFNLFGMDGAGFRALVLLPTPRRKYILAKNLALLPFALIATLVMGSVAAIAFRQSALAVVVTLLQVMQLYFMCSIVGNFWSIAFPIHIAWEGMRSTQVSNLKALITLVCLVVTVALIAVNCAPFVAVYFLEPGGYVYPITLALYAVLLALTLFLYAKSLHAAGDMLTEREKEVLDTLMRDRE